MSESRVFEVDLIVRGAGQEEARISREYRSKDAASTEKAARELWDAMSGDAKARMRPVNDDG